MGLDLEAVARLHRDVLMILERSVEPRGDFRLIRQHRGARQGPGNRV